MKRAEQHMRDNPHLYAEDCEEVQHFDKGPNKDYDFDVEEFDEGPQEAIIGLDPEELSRLEKELLFCVQGVGSIKSVAGKDVYMKSEHCEESIKDLIKHLKFENVKLPVVKQILGKWKFLSNDLLPLLVFHNKDKKLSFLTLMMLVQLTEIPAKDCESLIKNEIFGHLTTYKTVFLEPRVIDTLMAHLADCLQKEEKTTKHN
jgi:hypothetical protein